MQKIIALAIVLAGIGGGLALGVALRPGDAPDGQDGVTTRAGGQGGEDSAENAAGNDAAEPVGADSGNERNSEAGGDGEAGADREYIKAGRQIVVPVVNKGETKALMMFDLAIGVPRTMAGRTSAAEPRLRDAFLRVLFEMSYTGAFSSTYTDERVVDELRGKLLAAARRVVGDAVGEVLILDILRQEL
jgi:flagellar FliL protein